MKVAFTIVTSNYLAQAKTLGDSIIKYNPDYTFIIGLIDKLEEDFPFDFFSKFEIVTIDQNCVSEFASMEEKYTIFELSNAIKPYFAEYLLNLKVDVQVLVYFDSDIMVFSQITEIDILLRSHSILLTAHISSPYPQDQLIPLERIFLNAGIYNGGFFALACNEQAFKFLRWWQSKLQDQSFVNFAEGMFVDQLWLNFVPLFFSGFCLISHPGYNVAYWNLHERIITKNNGIYIINNDNFPLVFYHYSGYDPNQPGNISKYQNRFTFNNIPYLSEIFETYKSSLQNNKFNTFSTLKCYYVKKREEKLWAEEQLRVKVEEERIYHQRLKEAERKRNLTEQQKLIPTLKRFIRRTINLF